METLFTDGRDQKSPVETLRIHNSMVCLLDEKHTCDDFQVSYSYICDSFRAPHSTIVEYECQINEKVAVLGVLLQITIFHAIDDVITLSEQQALLAMFGHAIGF